MKQFSFVLVTLFAMGSLATTGCGGKDKKADEKKNADEKKADEKKDDKPADNSQPSKSPKEILVGTWESTLAIDDAAFAKFVEDNMLPEDAAEGLKKEMDGAKLSVVVNADGTYVTIEPDGNVEEGTWSIVAEDGKNVTIKTKANDGDEETAKLVLASDNNSHTWEPENDPEFEALPIKKPVTFTRK